jgi:2,4-dienoyl-CoA reductase-like NADH-dependent reductase (Old Yellow Enzyme family)
MSYIHLFSPAAIGGLTIRNRIVLPSMTTRLAAPSGEVTPELTSYYRERARGGCGLVIVEMASPQRRGRHRARELGIDDDGYLPGLRTLVKAVQDQGARVGIQLGHGGARALPTELGGHPLAAMAGPVPVYETASYTNFPELFDEESLEQLVVDHVDAARRAQEAGFDLVELHGAHGYLLAQLGSADENHVLADAKTRYAFLASMVRRITASVEIPLSYRISGHDYYDKGATLNDTLAFLSHLEDAGVAAISVTGGHYKAADPEIMIPPMPYADGVFLEAARSIKATTQLPVIAAGRLNTPEIAEHAVAEGWVDFVAIGRGQIADPHWARKTQQHHPVRECLACNHCVRTMRSGGQLACAVNPSVTSAERNATFAPPQRRLVIGAGPAGLTYALESARAGHSVFVLARDRSWRAAQAPSFNSYLPDRVRMNRYFEGLWQEVLDAGVLISAASHSQPPLEWLSDVDLVVDARGANYVGNLGPIVRILLRALRFVPLPTRLVKSARLHHILLYDLRKAQVGPPLSLRDVPTIRIGDAAQPGELAAAVHDAYYQAWKENVDA